MKVYSQKQINALMDTKISILRNSIIDICIKSVQEALNKMVMHRDYAEIKSLHEELESIQIDILHIAERNAKQNIPTPKNTAKRKLIVKKLDERTK